YICRDVLSHPRGGAVGGRTAAEIRQGEAMSAEQVNRDQALAKAFVTLADTLVADYDVIDVLHQLTLECVELLRVDAAGLLLSDQRGTLQITAASTERAR